MRRGAAYAEAGADALLIHSKQDTPDEILAFCRAWLGTCRSVSRIAATSARIAWFPQMTRPTFPSAATPQRKLRVAGRHRPRFRRILAEGGIAGVEGSIASVAEVFALQGDPRLRELDRAYLRILPRRRVHPCPAPNSLR